MKPPQPSLARDTTSDSSAVDDQPGILAVGENDGLLEVCDGAAATLFGNYDLVFGHFLLDFAGNTVHKLAFLFGEAPDHNDAGNDECEQCGERDCLLQDMGFGSGLFDGCICHSISSFFLSF